MQSQPIALVVEDQPFNQAVITTLLKQMGFAVEVAGDGAEGLEKLRCGGHTVALIDCQLPDFDGFELARRYHRSALAGTHAPVLIALSAHQGEDFQERCREAGIAAGLTKPLKRDLLRQVLDEAGIEVDLPDPAAADAHLATITEQVRASVLSSENLVLLADTAAEDLAGCREAMKAGDLDRVARLAHRLKGSFAFAGIEAAREEAGNLEMATRDGDEDTRKALLARLERIERQIRDYLR